SGRTGRRWAWAIAWKSGRHESADVAPGEHLVSRNWRRQRGCWRLRGGLGEGSLGAGGSQGCCAGNRQETERRRWLRGGVQVLLARQAPVAPLGKEPPGLAGHRTNAAVLAQYGHGGCGRWKGRARVGALGAAVRMGRRRPGQEQGDALFGLGPG